MEDLVSLLMHRDNLTQDDAIDLIQETKELIYDAIDHDEHNNKNTLVSIMNDIGLPFEYCSEILNFNANDYTVQEADDKNCFSVKFNFTDDEEWVCEIEDSCNEFKSTGNARLFTSKTDFILNAINDFLEENDFEGEII